MIPVVTAATATAGAGFATAGATAPATGRPLRCERAGFRQTTYVSRETPRAPQIRRCIIAFSSTRRPIHATDHLALPSKSRRRRGGSARHRAIDALVG